MQCWVCGSAAQGVCRFCGRAICRDDAKTLPFVLEVYPSKGELLGLALDDALYCGVCQPKAEPVRMEFLELSQQADDPPPSPSPARGEGHFVNDPSPSPTRGEGHFVNDPSPSPTRGEGHLVSDEQHMEAVMNGIANDPRGIPT